MSDEILSDMGQTNMSQVGCWWNQNKTIHHNSSRYPKYPIAHENNPGISTTVSLQIIIQFTKEYNILHNPEIAI